jgi:hypothetical protein
LLDGHSTSRGELQGAPGTHQLVAIASGQVVFAQWVAIATSERVRVVLPGPEPCSRVDLTSATPECPSWVSAKHDGDRFVVRSCAGASCGAELLVAPLPRLPGKEEHTPHRGLPAWAAWTLAGTGVVAVGVIISVATYFAIPPIEQTVFKTTKPQQ